MQTNSSLVRIGTSSFSSADWVGPFYSEALKPSEFLRYYSQQFDTVEVDSTYYTIPGARIVDSWAEKTPDTFLISAKFPRAIVHGGESSKPNPQTILAPDPTYLLRDRFLEAMSRLGPRLGPLVLQFPFFAKQVFPDAGEFVERLNAFLEELPRDYRYAVEIRNRAWLTAEFAEFCRAHKVALVLVDQAWMPHGDELEQKFDPITSEFAYIRLLGDRQKIEAITQTWDKEVIDRQESLERWAKLLARLYQRQMRSLVYINNHYAGHAPATARRLQTLVTQALNDPL